MSLSINTKDNAEVANNVIQHLSTVQGAVNAYIDACTKYNKLMTEQGGTMQQECVADVAKSAESFMNLVDYMNKVNTTVLAKVDQNNKILAIYNKFIQEMKGKHSNLKKATEIVKG